MNISNKIQFSSYTKKYVLFKYVSRYSDENYNRVWIFMNGRVGSHCCFVTDDGNQTGSADIGHTEHYKLFGCPT